jgi:hypothetical protein
MTGQNGVVMEYEIARLIESDGVRSQQLQPLLRTNAFEKGIDPKRIDCFRLLAAQAEKNSFVRAMTQTGQRQRSE